MHFEHPSVTPLQHALAQHHLAGLRDASTAPAVFRQHVDCLAALLAAELTRDLPLQPVTVQTPMESTAGFRIAGRLAIVPILRAGLGMTEAFLRLLPDAEVRHLGICRDEATALPMEYYKKLPNSNPADVAIITDPMLATGGSILHAVQLLKNWGVPQIRFACLIAAPEGLQQLTSAHPDVQVFTASIDRQLNDRSYILPGLGDAGDRIFNTANF
ncbi:MAG: uracil phosphoribosyltransferase [Planctomycetaceae bacterium]